MLSRIVTILEKEFIFNIRSLHQILSVMLYLFCASYIAYKVLGSVNAQVWLGIFWILLLFIAISATNLSFSNESGRRAMFFYQLYNPYELLIAKMIFNFFFLFALAVILTLVLQVFLPVEIRLYDHYFGAIALSSLGISAAFSFVAGITNMNNSSMSLMTIMALPTVLPVFLLGMKIMAQGLGIVSDSDVSTDYLLLSAIDLIIIGIILLLFPSLWKS